MLQKMILHRHYIVILLLHYINSLLSNTLLTYITYATLMCNNWIIWTKAVIHAEANAGIAGTNASLTSSVYANPSSFTVGVTRAYLSRNTAGLIASF